MPTFSENWIRKGWGVCTHVASGEAGDRGRRTEDKGGRFDGMNTDSFRASKSANRSTPAPLFPCDQPSVTVFRRAMSEIQVTPLNAFHRRHGGRMVDFAGWDMPVQYKSILEEHKAVRQRAGLFDVSHMGEAEVKGPEALKFLQHLVSNDCSKLFPGRVLYTVMCYPHGGVVDDLLVYMRGTDDYFLCINAGNIAKDIAWMQEQAKGFNCTVIDRSKDYGQLAIQGPKAVEIVQALTKSTLADIKYYHFADSEVAGVPCIISRTGYTGEDGVELYCAAADTEKLAEAILGGGCAARSRTHRAWVRAIRCAWRRDFRSMVTRLPIRSIPSRPVSAGW